MVRYIPNLITIARFIGILCFPLILNSIQGSLVGILYIFLFYYLSDQLDGFCARRFNATSELGRILDITVDRFCDLYLSCFALILFPLSAIYIIPFLTIRFMFEHLVHYNDSDTSSVWMRQIFIEANLLGKTFLWISIFTPVISIHAPGIFITCLTILFGVNMMINASKNL
jgi:phosphatidylglycerophosphate synthase